MLLTYSILLTLMKHINTQYLQNQRIHELFRISNREMLKNISLNTPHTLLNQTLFHSRGWWLDCAKVYRLRTMHHYPYTWTILYRTKLCSYVSIHNKYTTHNTLIFQHFQFRRNVIASLPHERRGRTEAVSRTAHRPTFVLVLLGSACLLAASVKVFFKFSTDGSHTSSGQLLREYATQHAWFHHLLLTTRLAFPDSLTFVPSTPPLSPKKTCLWTHGCVNNFILFIWPI